MITWSRWCWGRGGGRESSDEGRPRFGHAHLGGPRQACPKVSLASPAGLLLGLLAIPILALHMLRPRRPPLEVSSTFLWEDVSRPVTAARPWQKLRPSVLLIL